MTTANNEAALNAFVAAKFKIDALLARIQDLSDEHFNTNPESVNWSDVSTLNYYASILRQVIDSAFSEGENA